MTLQPFYHRKMQKDSSRKESPYVSTVHRMKGTTHKDPVYLTRTRTIVDLLTLLHCFYRETFLFCQTGFMGKVKMEILVFVLYKTYVTKKQECNIDIHPAFINLTRSGGLLLPFCIGCPQYTSILFRSQVFVEYLMFCDVKYLIHIGVFTLCNNRGKTKVSRNWVTKISTT